MDPLAFGFIALAAILHAAWNILLKAADDPLRTAADGVAAASAVLVPLVLIGWLTLGRPAVPPQAWALGITSGGVEVLYFAFLAAAFRRGDLSVVYPLARGSAPLLAIAIGVVILGERLAPGAWLGVGLLLAGLLLVQRPWRLLRSATSANDRAAAGFALLTGATIASGARLSAASTNAYAENVRNPPATAVRRSMGASVTAYRPPATRRRANTRTTRPIAHVGHRIPA